MTIPDWDTDQLGVILEDSSTWLLVIAGPGAGKSAVACQRIAYLHSEGISPTRILMISFTRTAVSEIRNRIKQYSETSDFSSLVRISTIDSHAWSLLNTQHDQEIPKTFSKDSYEAGIENVLKLLSEKSNDLVDFIESFEHIIIDEAQDVVGLRAQMIVEILKKISPECGVTILADPIQAIYGWTNEIKAGQQEGTSLLSLLGLNFANKIITKDLKQVHRIENESLKLIFEQGRIAADHSGKERSGHIRRIFKTITELSCHDYGLLNHSKITDLIQKEGKNFNLILFRGRADALMASSFFSECGIEHRLRLSGLPTVVKPWIGWVFQDAPAGKITKEQFLSMWESQSKKSSRPFESENSEECWLLLRRFAASRHPNLIDLDLLNNLISSSKPPLELSYSEFGSKGPIIGTIHASKGREAEDVLLILPSNPYEIKGASDESIFEEGRVYYVGATRARKALSVAETFSPSATHLESGRAIHLKLGSNSCQAEIGRDEDVLKTSHLTWSEADKIQLLLANLTANSKATIRTHSDKRYRSFIELHETSENGITRLHQIGEMSEGFSADMWSIANIIGKGKQYLKPPTVYPHIYIAGATTVALSESERIALQGQVGRSGFALAPVIKGYSYITCTNRKGPRQ